MRSRPSAAIWLVLLVLLVGMLYPVAVLRRVVAPEVSLRGQAPWRVQWGPFPAPQPEQVRAASELGARLSLLERDARGIAIWNPWVGGGRAGWMASAREGGSPLPLLAVALARQGMAWTGLVALQLAVGFLSCAWMLRRLSLGPWPSALGGLCYALAGPTAVHWLDWQGSAMTLGPLAVALALGPRTTQPRAAIRWATIFTVLGFAGPPALPFVALAVAAAAVQASPRELPRQLVPVAAAALVAAALLAPRLWLAAAGREPGAQMQPPSIEAPLPSLRALASRPSPFDPAGPQGTQQRADSRGYLGAVTLLLAAVGLLSAPSRQRGLWGGALLACLALAWAPTTWLVRAGMGLRPLGVMALSAAALAAFGLELLGRGIEQRRRVLIGAPAVALVAWSMLPIAARHVPYSSRAEATLPVPLPPAASVATPRVVGLFGCLPPDLGAAAGLPDVRAGFLEGEPRYAGLLPGGPGGSVSASRALSPGMAALGVGTLLEPLPLRVVSSEIFSRIEVDDGPTAPGPAGTLLRRLELHPGTCRLGVPAAVEILSAPTLRLGSRSVLLRADETLAAESAEWRWFALPALGAPASVALSVGDRGPATIPLAIDRTGLRQVSEGGGVRVWSTERAVPFASLTWPAGEPRPSSAACPGSATVEHATSERVDVTASSAGSCSLLVQVKYRPALWRATVNGQPAQTLPCAEVWTCVPVPAGESTVELRAAVPWPVRALFSGGLVALAALAWVGRKA